MRAPVTGGAGFNGSAVCRQFDETVLNLDRLTYAANRMRLCREMQQRVEIEGAQQSNPETRARSQISPVSVDGAVLDRLHRGDSAGARLAMDESDSSLRKTLQWHLENRL